MRVSLIFPPRPAMYLRLRGADNVIAPPLGLAYVGAALELAGVDTDIIDMSAEWMDGQALSRRLESRGPDVVGISCNMAMFEREVLALAAVVKRLIPDTLLIVGGNHATFRADEFLTASPDIDGIVLFEGEETMRELVTTWCGHGDLTEVPGLALRDKGRILRTSPRPRLEHLDELPLPARHLLRMDLYSESYRGLLITSRGCPYRCSFCSTAAFNGGRVRVHGIARIMAEIDVVKHRHLIPMVTFVDDTFTIDRRRTEALCRELMQSFPGLSWACETRVDLVDRDLLQLMKNAGCRRIFFGVESVNQAALDRVYKGFHVEQARRTLKDARSVGIDTQASFIIGLPEDDEGLVEELLAFIEDTSPSRVMIGMLALYPGTALYEKAADFGVLEFSRDWSRGQQLTPMVITEWMDAHAQARCYVRIASALSLKWGEEGGYGG